MALTAKQLHFAQLVAAGSTFTDAYRQAYNVSPDANPATHQDHAYDLAHHAEIAPMIAQLRDAARSQAVGAQAWNLDRIVQEAEMNLQLAREHRQLGSANGALELIGRVTGIISDRPLEPQHPITRVVIVLNRGNDAAGRPQLVEAAYEVLPPGKDMEEDDAN